MDVGFEALADHADGVANAVLRVDQKFVRENVQDFAVFGKRDVAGGIDGAANVVAFDVARTMAEGDAAAAVDAAHEAAGHADHGGFHRNVGDAFGFFDGAANGTDGRVEIDDQALCAGPWIPRRPEREISPARRRFPRSARTFSCCRYPARLRNLSFFAKRCSRKLLSYLDLRHRRAAARIGIQNHLP